jgi:hypothetical protein
MLCVRGTIGVALRSSMIRRAIDWSRFILRSLSGFISHTGART